VVGLEAAGLLVLLAPGSLASPEQAWWRLFNLYTAGAIALAGGVAAVFAYLLFKYRDRPGAPGEAVTRPGVIPGIEIGAGKAKFSLVVTGVIVVALTLYSFGYIDFYEFTPQEPGGDKLVVWVEGVQFAWIFKYPQGFTSTNELVLPADTLVELKVTSRDVFHSFGIPGFKVKTDAIPGIVNSVWFRTPSEPGEYRAYCYELCGSGHSIMVAKVRVVDRDSFNQWVQEHGASGGGS